MLLSRNNFSISVVLPTYNRLNRIKKCLPTFLATKLKDAKFIIIDNNSNDGTWDYLKSVANSDKRVEIYKNPQNIGPLKSCFRGYCEVRSPYVLFLADDDIMEGDYIAKCLKIFQDHKDVGAVHHFLGGWKAQQKIYKNSYTIYSKGHESITSLFMLSGSHPGLAFRMRDFDLKNFPLGDKVIYPSVKIALEIASKHNTALIHDCGLIASGFDTTILENKKTQNRPDGLGINERLSYLLSIKNPLLVQKLAIQLTGYSMQLFEELENLSAMDAKKFIKSLLFSLNSITPYFILSLLKIKKFKFALFSIICLIRKPYFLVNYLWFFIFLISRVFVKLKLRLKQFN